MVNFGGGLQNKNGCNFSRRERAQACDANIVPCARHPSQLYEAILEGFFLFLILLVLVRFGAFKRPGLLTGVFLMWYGLSRFLVEYFRVPDAQFFLKFKPLWLCLYFGDFGLTMGQALSLPMIFAGLLLLTIAIFREKYEK